MMETDNTFDEIVLWCEQHKIKHYADKWSVGCILIEEQQGFPVPCDIGFWTGIGKRKLQQVETFGVQLYTPTTLDKT